MTETIRGCATRPRQCNACYHGMTIHPRRSSPLARSTSYATWYKLSKCTRIGMAYVWCHPTQGSATTRPGPAV